MCRLSSGRRVFCKTLLYSTLLYIWIVIFERGVLLSYHFRFPVRLANDDGNIGYRHPGGWLESRKEISRQKERGRHNKFLLYFQILLILIININNNSNNQAGHFLVLKKVRY